jgi:hypothetical protein
MEPRNRIHKLITQEICPECKGKTKIKVSGFYSKSRTTDVYVNYWKRCPSCFGIGYVSWIDAIFRRNLE